MKKVISICLAAVLSASGMNIVWADNNKVSVYVSPTGNDNASGALDAPLKTPEAAQSRARLYMKESKAVEVIFRGGEYRMTAGWSFTGEDSGTADNPIVYKAYEGEKVEFKGSQVLDISKASRVTDEKVLSKLKENVKNKVVALDLAKQGITEKMIKQYVEHNSEHTLNGGEVNGLYQNGSPQTVAEWPNGFGNFTSWDRAESNYVLHYTDTEPNKWQDVKYAWIGGYPTYDFQYTRKSVKSIDKENGTITASSMNGTSSFTSSQSRRWKIFNLLEELDVPGEYYIDPDTMMLYWYPEEAINNSRVEFSWLSDSMINIQNAENITFENLCFTQTRGTAVSMKRVKNVDFYGCEFTDIGARGMYIYSDKQAETDKDYWQRNQIDGSYDCDIVNCKFDNIGHNAVSMNGGNVDTLTKSNNRIENNTFTRCAQLSRNNPAIIISGCGNSILNNEISNCPFHAVNIWGNDHTINYNEIFDVIQESDDCGAIYCGRNTLHRGTEIAYNYIHDIKPVKDLVYNFQGAIYLDDREGGYDIHHNIIKNARIDLIVNGGVDINYSNNTSIDIERYYMRFINGGIAENTNSAKGVWEGYIADEELYYKHYPHLKDLIEKGKISVYNSEMAKYNTITGNLAVSSCEASIGTDTMKYGVVKNNVQLEECEDFVNPEAGDYRIKNNSETYSKAPNALNEDFDINKIGVNKAENKSKASKFTQLYPKNGQQGIDFSSIDFEWQKAENANTYRIIISKNPDMSEVVFDEQVHYNVITVDGLESNTVYYWKVYAAYNSFKEGEEWEAAGPVYSFKTSLYSAIDTEYLESVTQGVKESMSTMDIGDQPGQYPQKLIEQVNGFISVANKMSAARLGMIKQENIDKIASAIASSFNSIGQTNLGYVDLSKYFLNADNWTKQVEISDNNEVKIQKSITGANNIGINSINHMAGSVLYSFDAKLDIENGYAIFGINKDSKMNPYAAANNGYSFLFKPNLLELHVTSGSSQTIVVTQEHNYANDGKFHKIEYGYINTDIGNMVLLWIDGEKVIEYLDVINQAVNVTGGFMLHLAGAGQTITLKQSEQIGTTEKLNEILEECYYNSAKRIIDSYEKSVIAIQENGDKIFTSKGVYNTEGVVESKDGVLMLPFESISKVFDAKTQVKGNSYTVEYGDKTTAFTLNSDTCTVNGAKKNLKKAPQKLDEAVKVPLEDLLDAMELTHTYSGEQGLLIVGDIIFMNNMKAMKKTKQLMDIMKQLSSKDDYIFEDRV